MIRVPQLRVVDEDGSQLGVMPTGEAFRLAQEKGYDLVEVAPMAQPPVARFLDYGQFKYEQARREKEARRHQRSVEFKEIRLTPKIGVGDFDTKVRRAIQFLEEGDRLKVSVRFRGRELSHAYLGRDLLTRFADDVKDHGTVERQPLLEGKQMYIVMASTHKPKGQEVEARPARPAEAERAAPAATPAPAAPVAATAPEEAAPAAAVPAAPVEAAAPPAEPAAAPTNGERAAAPRAATPRTTTPRATSARATTATAAAATTPTPTTRAPRAASAKPAGE